MIAKYKKENKTFVLGGTLKILKNGSAFMVQGFPKDRIFERRFFS